MSAVGKVKPSASSFSPMPGVPSAAVADLLVRVRRQIAVNTTLVRAKSSVFTRRTLVWCLRNSYTFVALKLAWGEARGRECIRSDTRPTEQRSPRPISAQPEGRHVFWAEALLLAPHRSTAGYARRSRLASAQNPLP